jgi:hypothetical protein
MPSNKHTYILILLSTFLSEEKVHVSFCPYLGKRKKMQEVEPQTLASFFE